MPITVKPTELFELELLCRNSNIDDGLHSINQAKLIVKLNKLDISHLTHICVNSPLINEHLRRPQFKDFWAKHLASLNVHGDNDFHFQSQSKLHDIDLILAYDSYLQAMLEEKTPKKISLLLKGSVRHSLHCLQYLGHLLIIEKSNKFLDSFIIQNFLPLLEKEALYHGTPVYLLITKIYYFLATQPRSLRKIERHSAYYLALKNLYKAKLSLNDSAAAIHNAYFGEGLAMSNPYSINSIEEMLLSITQEPPILDEAIQKRAHSEAAYEMQNSVSKDPLEPQPLSPLFKAVINNNPDQISQLRRSGKNLEETNEFNETALMLAARLKHLYCVRLLLSFRVNTGAHDKLMNNALHFAFANGDLGISRLLLKAQPALLESKNIYHLKPADVVQQADTQIPLFSGDSKDYFNSTFDHTLKIAVRNKNNEGILECLVRGANPNVKIESKTALSYLVNEREPELIERLLDFGADLDEPNTNGETPIFEAYRTSQPDLLLHFLKLGANPNVKNILGQTLLINAVKKQDLTTVKLLVNFNVDVNLTDNAGHSALFYTLSHTKTDIAQCLLEHQADANKIIRMGKSIMQIAKERGKIDLLELMEKESKIELTSSIKNGFQGIFSSFNTNTKTITNGPDSFKINHSV